MGLSQPVGYLYWYTTSIILGILTIINFSTKIYHYLTKPKSLQNLTTTTTTPIGLLTNGNNEKNVSGSNTTGTESSETQVDGPLTSPMTSPNASSHVEKSSLQSEKRQLSKLPRKAEDLEKQIKQRRLGKINRLIRSSSVLIGKYFYLSGITIKSRKYKLFGLGKVRKFHKRVYATPELLWTWGYTLGFLILCFYGTGWDTLTWCNQAAWLAVAQVPLIIALAGKNNLISFLTGISYDRLNYIHRAAAKLCLLGVWIHAGGHWRITHGWNKEIWGKTISHWGFTGTFAITLLSALSMPFFRRRMFEFFLVAHIALVALMLAAFVMHWRAMDVWIYPGAGLWAADRILRCLRLIVLNKLWLRPSISAKDIPSKATISLLTPSTLLLRFDTPSEHLNWSAGHHFYVVMPGMSRLPWEAHPFTAATIPLNPGHGTGSGELAFIIRVRDGFTKQMKNKIDKVRKEKGLSIEDKLDVEVSAAVEGPYGEKSDLSGYEGILIFSGGSGISFAVSNLLQILKDIKKGKSRVKFISIIWMVKSRLHLEWISPLLKNHVNDLPPDLSINIHVHVTRHLLPKLSIAPTNNLLSDMEPGDLERYLNEKSKQPKRRRSRFMSTFSWASWTGASNFGGVGGTQAGTRRGSMAPSDYSNTIMSRKSSIGGQSNGSQESEGKKINREQHQQRLFGSFASSNLGGPSTSAAAAAANNQNQQRRRSSLAISGSESEGEKSLRNKFTKKSKTKRRPSIPTFNWTEGYADNSIFGGGNNAQLVQELDPHDKVIEEARKDSLLPYSVPGSGPQELEIVLKEPTPVEGVRSTAFMPEPLSVDLESPPLPSTTINQQQRQSISNRRPSQRQPLTINTDIGPDEIDPFDYRPPSPTTPPEVAEARRDSRSSIPWMRDRESFSSSYIPQMNTPPRTRQISISEDLPLPRQKRISISEESPNRALNNSSPKTLPQSRSGSLSNSLPGTPINSFYNFNNGSQSADQPSRKRSIPLLQTITNRRESGRRDSLPLQAAQSISHQSSPRPSILMPTPILPSTPPTAILRSSMPSRPSMLETVHSSSLLNGSQLLGGGGSLLAAPEMSRSSTAGSGASMATFGSVSSPGESIVSGTDSGRPNTPFKELHRASVFRQLNNPEDISRPETPSKEFKQISMLSNTPAEELKEQIQNISTIKDPKIRRDSVNNLIGTVELELRKKSSEGLEGLVRWHEGRANIKESIKEIIESVNSYCSSSSNTLDSNNNNDKEEDGLENLMGSGGRVNVSCCGPISLLDAVRDGVKDEMNAEKVLNGGVLVEFHAETFGW
ncbi:uncharacterized protein L201_005394 [Kwoniella dendrophila CBS 6074]|uniref:FAD-binding FR-type domain-containing protein n=1 Tax=Kwoniella dendrophila CBS 6074 TaxID=1295534 RepID=A0AAX4K008_9TREE